MIKKNLQKIGKRYLEMIFILLFLLISLNESFFYNIETYLSNTGFYYYSSFLQANVAIISIVAVFFISRIQSLQSNIDNYYNTLLVASVNDLEYKYYISFRNHSLSEKIKDIENMNYNEEIHKEIMFGCIKIIKIYERTKKIIFLPLMLLLVMVVIDSICLLSVNYVHSMGSHFEIKIFLLVLIGQIYCLLIVMKTIYATIKS